MKILTGERLERVRQLAMAADALVSQAEAIVRNAHRSQRLRFQLTWAQDSLAGLVTELRCGAGHYDPPRTRKVERMERMERERKEKRMKRVTMGGSPKAQEGPRQASPRRVPGRGERTKTGET